jgi:hypothetical protein
MSTKKVSSDKIKSALGGDTAVAEPKKKRTTKKSKAEKVPDLEQKSQIWIPEASRPEPDWNKEVDPKALFSDDDGNQFIPLKELERIARKKGYVAFPCQITSASPIFAAATATIQWKDGTSETGCADAGPHNVPDANFSQYPVAMAQARARARALRFGLNINLCSKEEIGTLSGAARVDESGPIQPHHKACIQAVAGRKGVSIEQILSLGESEVESLDDLNVGQATEIIRGLSDGTIEKLLKE